MSGPRGKKRKADDVNITITTTEQVSTAIEVPTTTVLTLPADLIQPLYCKLCSTSLNSPQQAQSHYQGKNHAKKVRQYLQKQSQALLQVHLQDPLTLQMENSLPSSPVEQNGNGTSPETNGTNGINGTNGESENGSTPPSPTVNGNGNGAMHTKLASSDDFCKICAVSFNSPAQAKSHYEGKNHAKKQKSLQTTNNNTTVDIAPKTSKKLLCFVCNVNLNSEAQLQSHLKSYKHQQKVLQEKKGTTALQGRWGVNNDTPPSIQPTVNGTGNGIPVGIRILPQNTLPNQHGMFPSLSPPPAKKNPVRSKDLAMVMTPSGKFYCACCDLMLNSELQYRQHLQSKKHRAKHACYRKPELLL